MQKTWTLLVVELGSLKLFVVLHGLGTKFEAWRPTLQWQAPERLQAVGRSGPQRATAGSIQWAARGGGAWGRSVALFWLANSPTPPPDRAQDPGSPQKWPRDLDFSIPLSPPPPRCGRLCTDPKSLGTRIC